MVGIGLSVILLALIALMLLLPPWLLMRSAARLVRQLKPTLDLRLRLAATTAAIAPLFFNIFYMAGAWRDLAGGRLDPDQLMGIAVLISWLAFWGHVALGRRLRAQPSTDA